MDLHEVHGFRQTLFKLGQINGIILEIGLQLKWWKLKRCKHDKKSNKDERVENSHWSNCSCINAPRRKTVPSCSDKIKSASNAAKMSPNKLTCAETYSMQSSNFDNIGIKPSPFTDKTGEFSFCKDREKTGFRINSKPQQSISWLPLWFKHFCRLAKSSLFEIFLFTSELSRHTFCQGCCADIGFFKVLSSKTTF